VSEGFVAKQMVDAAYRVHSTVGPGLLESVYETALAYELKNMDCVSLVSKLSP
jgi:GxxExxY protein